MTTIIFIIQYIFFLFLCRHLSRIYTIRSKGQPVHPVSVDPFLWFLPGVNIAVTLFWVILNLYTYVNKKSLFGKFLNKDLE
jgi:hypothetical protein